MAFSFNSLCSSLIPAGKYKAQVSNAEFKTIATGETTNKIVVKFTLTEGKYAKKVVSQTIGEKAFSFMLLPLLQACHVDTNMEFGTLEELLKYGIKEMQGAILMIDVTVSTYNGKQYNNVNGFTPLTESMTSTADIINEFNAAPVIKKSAPKTVAEELVAEDEEPKLNINLNMDMSDDDNPF